jgi:hypothetical protein
VGSDVTPALVVLTWAACEGAALAPSGAVGLAVVAVDLRRERIQLRAAYGLEESADDQHSDIDGLRIGQPAPPFSARSLAGQLVSLDDLRAAGQPLALLFVSPDCFACRQLVPYIVDWQRNASDNATIAVISSEMNELLGLCHRIGVVRQGRLAVILDGPTATEDQVMHAAAGVSAA